MVREQSCQHMWAAIRRGLRYADASPSVRPRKLRLRDATTIPVIVSLCGLGCVLQGARRMQTRRGVMLVVLGRSFDLLDGFLARALRQESDLGAAVDAVSDKIGVGYIVVQAWRRRIVPRWALVTVLASNLANASLTAVTVLRHPSKSFRPPRAGKLAMLSFNIGLLGWMTSNTAGRGHRTVARAMLRSTATAASIVGLVYAVSAATVYAKRAVQKRGC